MLRFSSVPTLVVAALVLAAAASAQDSVQIVPVGPPPAMPQSAPLASLELRALHARAVHATVQIVTPSGSGTGWLLVQEGRAIVITHRQLAERVDQRGARVLFYAGPEHPPVEVRAHRGALSPRIDLGVLRLDADPPASAGAVRLSSDTAITRGQRLVLGANLSAAGTTLPFQTVEGVVSGDVAGREVAACSGDRSCMVVDAAALAGAAGGPALDPAGQVAGMLWAGPRGTLAYVIPARVITVELATLDHLVPVVVAAAAPALPPTPPQNAVARVLSGARSRIAACGSAGTARLDLVVDGATGAVTSIDLDGVPFDGAAGRCVRNAVGALRFPRFSRPTFRVTFAYHLGAPQR